MKCQLPDGTMVEANKLIEPIGQFTHWYLNRNGEPRYLVIREANGEAYMFDEDVNKALTAALASGRYLVAVFTVEAAANGADRVVTLHRVARQFPYDAFEFAKTEFVKNLDTEYKPPQKLQLADFVSQAQPNEVVIPGNSESKAPQLYRDTTAPAELQRENWPAIPLTMPRHLDEKSIPSAANDALARKLEEMNSRAAGMQNDQASSDEHDDRPKAVLVDETVLVAADPTKNTARTSSR